MVLSWLMDRQRVPEFGDFECAVGAAGPAWDELTRRVCDDMGARAHPAGAVRSAWDYGSRVRASRSSRSRRTEDAFVALVVLGREQAEAAATAPLTARARRTFEEAKQLHDGRWLFLRIETTEDIGDVLALLALKLPARVRAAVEGAMTMDVKVRHARAGARGAAPERSAERRAVRPRFLYDGTLRGRDLAAAAAASIWTPDMITGSMHEHLRSPLSASGSTPRSRRRSC